MMTCSARHAGLCGDYRRLHPHRSVGPGSACKGWCCSCLCLGILGAMTVALILRRS